MRYIDPLTSSGKRDRSISFSSKQTNPSSPHNNIKSSDHNNCGTVNKRMKTSAIKHITGSASSNSRIFGDEISMNNTSIDEYIYPTHKRDGSIASKADTDTGTVTSDCGTTEGSVVAQLRGKLQDFGQKNQHHYIKNIVIPSKEELEKPLRAKVKPTIKDPLGPTPLPKHSADALVRRMMDHNHSSSSSSTPSIFRQRSTPVRIRIKATPAEDVQATNEGYASVAKLSEWLANDPTSTKKVKQLRRGANIIAKSRKFDKVLANAEIEHVIPRNCVTKSKQLLQKALSNDDDDIFNNVERNCNDDANDLAFIPDWKKLGTTASLSVSDKKKWLSNAFHQSGNNSETNNSNYSIDVPSPHKVSKARTEILSSSRNNNFGSVAKEKWRQRTPTKTSCNSNDVQEAVPMTEISSQTNNCGIDLMDSSNVETVKRHNGCSSYSEMKSNVNNDNNNDDDGANVDFHVARKLLVQRSKANGADVDIVNPFHLRKAKFQQLEKESTRRQSSVMAATSLYKPTWDVNNGGYVKTYKEDIAPKKSLNDLP
jgi:hypothetical protein